MKNFFIACAMLGTVLSVQSQGKTIESFNKEYLNWYNKDYTGDKIVGASVDRAYNELIKDLKPKKTVIVAVIDGGVDIYHEDLKGKIWVNEDEIPNNGIDDDNNGYVDDVNGWNFLGNKDGQHVSDETLEITRIVAAGDESNEFYEKAQNLYDSRFKKYDVQVKNIERFMENIKKAQKDIEESTGVKVSGLEDIKKVPSGHPEIVNAVKFLKKKYKAGFTEDGLNEYLDYCKEQLEYNLNKDFDGRKIIGDNPTDINDTDYGNNIVHGPTSFHGTFVAGIIAANRDNSLGINGIATDVKIMAIRCVPDGDERDKDVALSIRYAVDNGADIINMSFGKSISPNKKFVDDAVKYAEEKGVLLVHSAGNDGSNNDVTEVFPNCNYLSGGQAKNWITIGASSKNKDKELPAGFSNYGKKSVDFFAPGVSIVSLDTMSTYSQGSGTSFSSPVVSGVAALVLAYYPELKAEQLIEILENSIYAVDKPKKVLLPSEERGKRAKVSFTDLSKKGGVVNAYQALLYAKEKYGK